MKSLLIWAGGIALMLLALLLYALPDLPLTAYAATTTIIGWNFPNGTTFNNGMFGLILPLAGVGLFAGIPIALDYRGDFIVTMTLIGLLVGSLLGMLSMNANNPTLIPFGLVVEAGVFFGLWMWKGGTG